MALPVFEADVLQDQGVVYFLGCSTAFSQEVRTGAEEVETEWYVPFRTIDPDHRDKEMY